MEPHTDRTSLSKLVGQRLRTLRTRRGLSQNRLAELVGTRAGVISKIESGQSSVSLERLYEFARALQAEPHELLPSLDELEHGQRSQRRSDALVSRGSGFRAAAAALRSRH